MGLAIRDHQVGKDIFLLLHDIYSGAQKILAVTLFRSLKLLTEMQELLSEMEELV